MAPGLRMRTTFAVDVRGKGSALSGQHRALMLQPAGGHGEFFLHRRRKVQPP